MPDAVQQRWQPHMERITLSRDEHLYELHRGPSHLYFPLSALVSLSYEFDNGKSASIAFTGHEGLIGVYGLIENSPPTRQAVVQVGGLAWRVPVALAHETLLQDPAGLKLVLRYLHSVLVQTSQIGLCRGAHSVLQRVSRLLLMCDDRLPLRELPLTQERLARLMGVRREAITRALWQLSDQGLIETRRGHLIVVDRKGLQHTACECYRIIRSEMTWLLDTTTPFRPTPAGDESRSA